MGEPVLFNGGHLHCEPGWIRKRHSHGFYQVIIVYRGQLSVSMDREFTVGPGNIVFYPVNAPHEEMNRGGETAEILYLDWEGPDLNLPEVIHDNEGRIRVLAKWLLGDFKDSLYEKQDELENSLLKTILLELDKKATDVTDDFIRNVRALIYRDLASPLSLDSLASELGLNKYTLSKKYRRLAGKTPMEDVRLIRLGRARDLVISSDLSLNEIALRTGLTNEYHMSRIFRKYLNVPPGYFRKNH